MEKKKKTQNNIVLSNELLKEKKDAIDYERKKTNYINQKHACSVDKKYNKRLVYLYRQGNIIIDKIIYPLNSLYITYNTKKEDYDLHLISINGNQNDLLINSKEKIIYNGVVKFIDTTAFILLLKSIKEINNNCIIIKEKDQFLKIIKNWDGFLHQETSETDAIKNKNILERNIQ